MEDKYRKRGYSKEKSRYDTYSKKNYDKYDRSKYESYEYSKYNRKTEYNKYDKKRRDDTSSVESLNRSRSKTRSKNRKRSRSRNKNYTKRSKTPPKKMERKSIFATEVKEEEINDKKIAQPIAISSNTIGISNMNKNDQKLYIGNLPTNIESSSLVKYLNQAMKERGGSLSDEDSIIFCWLCKEQAYAFIDFRTVEETNLAINKLNGIMIGGNIVKINRPKIYKGGEEVIHQIDYQYDSICFPTKVLLFKNLIKDIPIENETDLENLKIDIFTCICMFGKVVRIEIPLIYQIDELNNDFSKLNTIQSNYDVYVETVSIDDSKSIRKKICDFKFNNKYISVKYIDEEYFYNKKFLK